MKPTVPSAAAQQQEKMQQQLAQIERLKQSLADAEKERDDIKQQLDSLHSFAGVRTLLQSILEEAYPPNTLVCSDKADADVGAQLTAVTRKILVLTAQAEAARGVLETADTLADYVVRHPQLSTQSVVEKAWALTFALDALAAAPTNVSTTNAENSAT